MRSLHYGVLGCVLTGFALGATAETMKPGLWEMRSQMGDVSGEIAAAMAEMEKEMANLPPEQRQMMESMMAQRGMQVKPSGTGMAIRMCLTQAMIDRNEVTSKQEGDCKQTRMSRSGNTTRFSVVCTNPPSTADGVVTHVSPQAYTATVTVKSVQDGKPHSMTVKSSAQFISSDCGNIKPLPASAGR